MQNLVKKYIGFHKKKNWLKLIHVTIACGDPGLVLTRQLRYPLLADRKLASNVAETRLLTSEVNELSEGRLFSFTHFASSLARITMAWHGGAPPKLARPLLYAPLCPLSDSHSVAITLVIPPVLSWTETSQKIVFTEDLRETEGQDAVAHIQPRSSKMALIATFMAGQALVVPRWPRQVMKFTPRVLPPFATWARTFSFRSYGKKACHLSGDYAELLTD